MAATVSSALSRTRRQFVVVLCEAVEYRYNTLGKKQGMKDHDDPSFCVTFYTRTGQFIPMGAWKSLRASE